MCRSTFHAAVPVRARVLLLVVALAAPAVAFAQQVGDNVNVLPVYKSVKCTPDATGKVVAASGRTMASTDA